ncbi:MAG: type III secretion system export apparatus subunit SctS [Desulfovibrio sp.]|jgi:type III secretion protein S|nr:type III secretion system export apparatus subunit SctS [Desulfovibrio sp.]
MNEPVAIAYAVKAMYLVLLLSLPPIIVASVVGLLLSLVQAITQLQEQTLTFGVKLLAVVLTIFMLQGWVGAELLRYATDIFSRFYLL